MPLEKSLPLPGPFFPSSLFWGYWTSIMWLSNYGLWTRKPKTYCAILESLSAYTFLNQPVYSKSTTLHALSHPHFRTLWCKDWVIYFNLQTIKLSFREAESLAQSHKAIQCQTSFWTQAIQLQSSNSQPPHSNSQPHTTHARTHTFSIPFLSKLQPPWWFIPNDYVKFTLVTTAPHIILSTELIISFLLLPSQRWPHLC